jgi:hypothetical protein
MAGKLTPFIDSENTYATSKDSRGPFRSRSDQNFGHPRDNLLGVCVGNSYRPETALKVRRVLGRLLVDVTYKSGTK